MLLPVVVLWSGAKGTCLRTRACRPERTRAMQRGIAIRILRRTRVLPSTSQMRLPSMRAQQHIPLHSRPGFLGLFLDNIELFAEIGEFLIEVLDARLCLFGFGGVGLGFGEVGVVG